MDALTVLTICATVFTLTAVVVAVFLVRALAQVRRTAAQAEAVLRRAEPLLVEAEQTVREYRAVGARLAEAVESVNRCVSQFGGLGTKTLDVARVVLSGVGGPLGRALALWTGLKAGLQVLLHLGGRGTRFPGRPSASAPTPPPEGSDSDG